MCAVWWKPGVFTQVGFTLTFSPPILYSLSVHNVGIQGRWVPLGNSLAIIKQHKTIFRGPFRIPTKKSFFNPPRYPNHSFVCFKCQAPKNIKCRRTVIARISTVTERPARPRVSAPICEQTSLYVLVPRPCHFNKIDLLTYLLQA